MWTIIMVYKFQGYGGKIDGNDPSLLQSLPY